MAKKYDQAIKSCRNSIQENPKISAFYNQLGLALNRKGEFEKANIFYQRALDLELNESDLQELDLDKILANTAQYPKKLQQKLVTKEPVSESFPITGNLEEFDGCLLKGWA